MIPITYCVLALALAADPAPLTADAAVVQLGTLPAHKPLVQAFRLKNVGPTPLTIAEVVGGCGCFRHQLGTRRLGPNEVTDLTVGIALLAQPAGPAGWKLSVRYAIGDTTGELPLRISATISREVAVEPAALMLSAEGEMTGTLIVLDRRKKPLTVTGVRVGIKGVTGSARVAKGDAQEVEIAVAADLPAGQYADEIRIDTNDPDTPEIRVPLRVVKKAPGKGVQAFPGSVSLRFAEDQATATSLVRLKDATDRQVGVEKVETGHPGITCKWAAGPDRMATLRVMVDRANAPASGIAVVSVKLATPTAETVLLPVSWGGPAGK